MTGKACLVFVTMALMIHTTWTQKSERCAGILPREYGQRPSRRIILIVLFLIRNTCSPPDTFSTHAIPCRSFQQIIDPFKPPPESSSPPPPAPPKSPFTPSSILPSLPHPSTSPSCAHLAPACLFPPLDVQNFHSSHVCSAETPASSTPDQRTTPIQP